MFVCACECYATIKKPLKTRIFCFHYHHQMNITTTATTTTTSVALSLRWEKFFFYSILWFFILDINIILYFSIFHSENFDFWIGKKYIRQKKRMIHCVCERENEKKKEHEKQNFFVSILNLWILNVGIINFETNITK